MNFQSYKKWLEEILVPNPLPQSVLVIDNASHHNVQADKSPTANSPKSTTQEWLAVNLVSFLRDMLKAALHELIKLCTPKYKKICSQPNTVLRLPPCHSDCNWIEIIWSQIKSYVVSKNVKNLCNKKILTIPPAGNWDICCRHIEQMERDYLKTLTLEEITEPFIINLCDDTSSESSKDVMSGVEELLNKL